MKSDARSPAAVLPMNSQFFLPRATCFMSCSTLLLSNGLLSIGMRPSVRYNCKAVH